MAGKTSRVARVSGATAAVVLSLVVGCAYKTAQETVSSQIRNGCEDSNGANLSNGLDLNNGADVANGADMANGADLANGLDLANGVDLTNGADLANGVDLSNGVDMTNGADLSNGIAIGTTANPAIVGYIHETGGFAGWLNHPDASRKANHCKILDYLVQCSLSPFDWVLIDCHGRDDWLGGNRNPHWVRGVVGLGRDWATARAPGTYGAGDPGRAMSIRSRQRTSACLMARANSTQTEGIIVDMRAPFYPLNALGAAEAAAYPRFEAALYGDLWGNSTTHTGLYPLKFCTNTAGILPRFCSTSDIDCQFANMGTCPDKCSTYDTAAGGAWSRCGASLYENVITTYLP